MYQNLYLYCGIILKLTVEKWKSNSFMLNNTTLSNNVKNKEYPENHHPFFFAEIVSFISFLHLSYQKRNRHGKLWLLTLPAIY